MHQLRRWFRSVPSRGTIRAGDARRNFGRCCRDGPDAARGKNSSRKPRGAWTKTSARSEGSNPRMRGKRSRIFTASIVMNGRRPGAPSANGT